MNSFEKSLGHWLLKCIVQFHFCWFSINNQHSWQIPRYRGIPVFISVGSRLITKLRESHLYQKWRWWLHFHPLIFFTSTTTLGKLLKLFFLCMLKTFLFWLFFFKLRNSIFLLEWTTRMPFLPASILSIFNDAHSIKGGTWCALSLPTLQFFPLFVILWCHSLKAYPIGQRSCVMSLTRCSLQCSIKSQGFCKYTFQY